MKNKKMDRKWFGLLSVALMLWTSCTESPIESESTGLSAKMIFNVASPITRAGSETEVTRMDILFFQNGILEKVAKNITSFTSTSDGKTMINVGFPTKGTRDAYFVVNMDETAWIDALQPGTTTEDNLKIIETKVLKQMAVSPFVMSGIKRGIVISDTPTPIQCTLTRTVARIDVKVVAEAGFTLTEARLINAKKTATVFSPGTPGTGEVGNLNLVGMVNNVVTLYTYENSANDAATATTVEVTGSVNNMPITYVVDFSGVDKQPIAINRNTHYTVSIGKVQNNEIDVTVTVKDWLLGADINYDYEGSKPVTEVHIDPIVGTYNEGGNTIDLKWLKGSFAIKTLANAECGVEIIPSDWLTLAPQTKAVTGIAGEFVFQISRNPSSATRKATIRVFNKLRTEQQQTFVVTQEKGTQGSKALVLCVGDDFVHGSKILSRPKNNLSAQIGYLLEDQFEVRGFGVEGATASKSGSKSYMSTTEYGNSLKETPDYVVILLGTNDTKAGNASNIGTYKADLLELVNSYKKLGRGPCVILAKPPRCFATSGDYVGTNNLLVNRVIPDIEAVAEETGAEIVDYYSLFSAAGSKYFADGIYPTSLGYEDMGLATYTAITGLGFDESLKPLGKWINPATKPRPSGAYSEQAGWTTGSDWHIVADEITTVLQNRTLKLLLLGNSITQHFGGPTRKKITTFSAKAGIDFFFGNNWDQAGISGDRTQQLLWRLKNGHYDRCNPEKVVITIGVNNIVGGRQTGEDTAEGVYACAVEAAKLFPRAKIELYGTLPTGLNPTDPTRIRHNDLHAKLATMPMPPNVRYMNLTSTFTNADGTLKQDFYNSDYLHLTSAGYAAWIPIVVRDQ